MAPLDLRQLRASTALCVAHGHSCPTGGGQWSRNTWEALHVAWAFLDVAPPSWETWMADEATRCRTATPAERAILAAADVEAERQATREAAELARRWLADPLVEQPKENR